VRDEAPLFQLGSGFQPRVEKAVAFLVSHLFSCGGYVQASLILAGVDFKGAAVYRIFPDRRHACLQPRIRMPAHRQNSCLAIQEWRREGASP
jgi:hypothetical protein